MIRKHRLKSTNFFSLIVSPAFVPVFGVADYQAPDSLPCRLKHSINRLVSFAYSSHAMNETTRKLEGGHESDDFQRILKLARGLLNGHRPGIFATVDSGGIPQMRWMSSFEVDELPKLRTLTNPGSRKVEQIRANPNVSWMFFDKDMSMILTLRGKARILDDPIVLKETWQKVVDLSLTYFLDQYAHKLGFVVVETEINSVELNCPGNGLRVEVPPASLLHGPE